MTNNGVPNMDEHSPDPVEPRISEDRLLDGEGSTSGIDDLGIEDVSSESKSSWYLFLLTLGIGG